MDDEPDTPEAMGYSLLFLLSVVGVALAVQFGWQRISRVPINSWVAYLGFSGGLFMAVDAIGAERAARLDTILTGSERRFRWVCNHIVRRLSVIATPKDSRRQLGLFYIFFVLDAILIAVLHRYTLPAIGLSDWIPRTRHYLAPYANQVAMSVVAVPLLPGLLAPIYLLLGRAGRRLLRLHLQATWAPLLLLGGWAAILWLGLTLVAWLLLQLLGAVIRVKVALQLGNILFVFGTILFLASFILFLAQQIAGAA
jgi:hypothetical protein